MCGLDVKGGNGVGLLGPAQTYSKHLYLLHIVAVNDNKYN